MIGDVERAIKFLLKLSLKFDNDISKSELTDENNITLEYEGYRYLISLEDPTDSICLSTWFDVKSPYIVVSHKGEWRTDIDPSSRRTFFSALVSAISSLDSLYYPIFFIPATRSNIEKASGLLGYRIYRFNSKNHDFIINFSKIKNSWILPTFSIINYESIVEYFYDRTTPFKQAICYLDGAYEYFMFKIKNYPEWKLYSSNKMAPEGLKIDVNKIDSLNDHMIQVKVKEYFNCSTEAMKFMAAYHQVHESNIIILRDSTALSLMNSIQRQYNSTKRIMKCNRTFSYLPSKYTSHYDDVFAHEDILLGQLDDNITNASDYELVINTSDEFNNGNYNSPTQIRQTSIASVNTRLSNSTTSSIANNLAATIPSSFYTSTVKSLDVNLVYSGSRHEFRVDNQRHTSLLPSKQLPSAWSCSISFSTLQTSIPSKLLGNSSEHQQLLQLYGHEYSTCVRNLLANYIISKSWNMTGISIANLFSSLDPNRVNADSSRRSNPRDNNLFASPYSPYNSVNDVIDSDKAFLFAKSANISKSTLDLVIEQCNRLTTIMKAYWTNSLNDNQAYDDQHNDFIRMLFSTSKNYFNPNILVNSQTSFPQQHNKDILQNQIDLNSINQLENAIGVKLPYFRMLNSYSISNDVLEFWTMVGVYSSTLSSSLWGISSLWCKCVSQLRDHWDNGIPIPHLNISQIGISMNGEILTTVDSQHDSTPSTLDSLYSLFNPADNRNLKTLPCQISLWNEMFENSSLSTLQGSSLYPIQQGPLMGQCLTMPNRNLSINNQKLQFLQFCSTAKNHSVLTTFPSMYETFHDARTSFSEDRQFVEVYRRLPLTDDVVKQHYRVCYKTLRHYPDFFSSYGFIPDINSSSETSLIAESELNQTLSTNGLTYSDKSLLSADVVGSAVNLIDVMDLEYTSTTPASDSIPNIYNNSNATIKSVEQKHPPVFKYQIVSPSLVSDVRAYKATYPESTFSDFKLWYGINSEESDKSDQIINDQNCDVLIRNGDCDTARYDEVQKLKEDQEKFIHQVWEVTDGCFARDQKPLFRLETEAEKCLSFFEHMSASKLVIELLISALPSLVTMLTSDLYTVILDLLLPSNNKSSNESNQIEDDSIKSICQELIDELDTIHQDTMKVIKNLRATDKQCYSYTSAISSIGSSGNMSPTLNSSSAIFDDVDLNIDLSDLTIIDSIELRMNKLEDFLIRYRAITLLLTPPSVDISTGSPISEEFSRKINFVDIKKLGIRLWKYNSIEACTESESLILFLLAKNTMIPGTVSGELAKSQGRELFPMKKQITLEKMNISHKDFETLKTQNEIVDKSIFDSLYHRLTIDVHDDRIRVSTNLVDFD